MDGPTVEDLREAAEQMAGSARGREAMRRLLSFLNAGLDLDGRNKQAAFTLLAGAFGAYGATARDAIREALGGPDA